MNANPPALTSVSDITCPSSSDCFATGADGTSAAIVATTNGAATWFADSLPSGVTSLASVSCTSTSDCFAAGDNSTSPAVVSTTNGGSSWATQTMPAGIASLDSISCVVNGTNTDCAATGANGSTPKTMYTTNGGTTWTVVSPTGVTSLGSVSCVLNGSAVDCVAIGADSSTATVLYSTNGGSSWTAVSPSGVTTLNGVSCVLNGSSTDCWAVGSSSSGAEIIASTNGGSSWSAETTPLGLTNLTSIDCTSTSDCEAAGNTAAGSGQVLSTTDGGTFWAYQFNETAHAYNQDGLVTTMTDGQGTTGDVTYTYDGLGRIVSSTDEEGNITTYGYDKVGNKTCVGYRVSSTTACNSSPSSSNHVVDYTYDGANRVKSLETWLTNASGPDSVSCYPGGTLPTYDTTYFGYDANGNMTCEALPIADSSTTDAVGLTFSYYGNNSPNEFFDATLQGVSHSATYTRNGAGMNTQETITSGATTINYYNTYDSLGRVSAQSTSANPANQYTYDSAGNITCMNGTGEVYNAIGAVQASTSACPSSADVNRYGYDSNGNRTSNCGNPDAGTDTSPDGCGYDPDGEGFEIGTFQTYNTLGQMTSYSVPLSKVTYTYSGEGLLLTAGSDTLTWDVSSTPAVLSDGSYDYIYAPNGRLMETISGSSHYYALDDAIGSVRSEIGTNGSANFTVLNYGPWGASTASSSPNIGYAGSWRDPSSGFYLMGNRFYDTGTGQFLTPDPANTLINQPYGFAGFNGTLTKAVSTLSPLSLGDPTQAYSYAQDDPLNLMDVSGEGIRECACKIILAVAIAVGSSGVAGPGAQEVTNQMTEGAFDSIVAKKELADEIKNRLRNGGGCAEE